MTTTNPTVKNAWRIGGSLLAVAALGFGTVNTVTVLGHRKETVVTVVDQPVSTLDVSGDGKVQVIGGDVSEITVTAEIDHGIRETQHSVDVEGDRLVVRSSCPIFLTSFCHVGYTIEVPADIDVVVHSDNGSVAITDVIGSIDAQSDNGELRIEGGTGELTLDSDNGSIEASGLEASTVFARSDNGRIELDFAAAPRSVDVSSSNGSVDVVVPQGSGPYVVDADSSNGSVDTLVRTDPDAERSIRAHSSNGDVRVRDPGG